MADKPDKVVAIEQCSTCKSWQPRTSRDTFAECHRYAPSPFIGAAREATWPLTSSTTTCGDYAVIPKK